jgi:glycosyltransferase involved in cell wall biosynthesis
MMNPDISIVMSVFNNADTLTDTLDSILSQEGVDLELIAIDDGSTDGSGNILDEAAARDSRMKVVHKRNEGLTRALAEGCAMAQGEYIARIDSGDIMLADRLSRQKDVLDRHSEVSFVSCWTEYCGPEWEPLYTYNGRGTVENGRNVLPDCPEENLKDVPSHHGSVMFRHDAYEAVGGYRWQFYYAQDWDLWYRLAEQGHLAIVPEVLYRARVFSSSLSAMNMDRQSLIVKQALLAFWCRQRGEPEAECLERAAVIRPAGGHSEKRRDQGGGSHFIGELLRKNGDVRCRRYFLKALHANLFRFNTWIRLLQSFHGTSVPKINASKGNEI